MWMDGSGGKQVFEREGHGNGSNMAFFQKIAEVHRVPHLFFIPDSVMNIFAPNRTNRIPFSPSLTQDHEYGQGFVYKWTYKENRTEIVWTYNLWFQISWWLVDENAWFKRQITLRSRHYQIHITIAWINEFDFQPYSRAARESVRFLLQFMKTDMVWCSRRWLMMKIQLNEAWINEIHQLPGESELCNSWNWSRFLLQMLQTEL